MYFKNVFFLILSLSLLSRYPVIPSPLCLTGSVLSSLSRYPVIPLSRYPVIPLSHPPTPCAPSLVHGTGPWAWPHEVPRQPPTG